MNKRSRTKLAGKNLLFAEIIVVIAFFSLAAAACVTMFAQAQQDINDARDLTNAVIMAQNAAEIFKAADDIEMFHSSLADIGFCGVEVESFDGTVYKTQYVHQSHECSCLFLNVSIHAGEVMRADIAVFAHDDVIYELIVAIPEQEVAQ